MGEGVVLGLGRQVGGLVVLRSVQQLFKLTLFELSIVSDFIKCVRLHNLPVLKDCVQQVLELNRKKKVGKGADKEEWWEVGAG